jgi:small subunit ribosomal protein S4
VKPGDAISWREGSTKTEYYKALVQEIEGRTIPGWLALDKEKLTAQVVNLPTGEDIEVKFNEKVIVEFYSR